MITSDVLADKFAAIRTTLTERGLRLWASAEARSLGHGGINKGKELKFTMMAEIQDCLNFSLNGEFTKAKIEKATVVAPDGKTYELAALGEQPPASEGNLTQFLWIQFGDAHTGFSVGSWKVKIKFEVDGASYEHEADYLITWRKPEDGIWGGSHWANESEKKAEQAAPSDGDKPAN